MSEPSDSPKRTPSPDIPPERQDREESARQAVAAVHDVLTAEAAAISKAASQLDSSVAKVIEILLQCKGRVIVSGMGKMSCIARKAAATFCSTGTPAIFLHPGEAAHGDLGIVSSEDIFLALSHSGETREVISLLPFMTRLDVTCIAISASRSNSLARRSLYVLETGVTQEADSIAVAPTNSTTTTLAICDGLAIALMNRRGFTTEQFAIFHPGGFLGGKLLIQVVDLMHTGETIPLAAPTDTLGAGVARISAKGMGVVFVIEEGQRLVGVVTDGDLRRIIEKTAMDPGRNVLLEPLAVHMTSQPKSIRQDALAADALNLLETHNISVLPVVDSTDAIVGVIHLHDLIRAGLA